jgi:hypothetical protein
MLRPRLPLSIEEAYLILRILMLHGLVLLRTDLTNS